MSDSQAQMTELASRPERQLRHPVKRRQPIDLAVAHDCAERLAQSLVGLQDVTAVCRHKERFGAFFEVTDGLAKGISGLLHVSVLPGGERALEALKIGDIFTLDITAAVVQTKRNNPVVKLAFDGCGNERRAAETRNAVFARGNVPSDGGSHWVKARRGKERYYG